MTDDDPPPELPPRTPRRDSSSPLLRLLALEAEPADFALAEQLRRVDGDYHLLAARLVRAAARDKDDSAEELQEQLGSAIKAQEAALELQERRLDALELVARDAKTGVRWSKVLGGAGLAIALAAASFVGSRFVTSEEHLIEYRVRIDHLERDQRDGRAALDRMIERLSKGAP